MAMAGNGCVGQRSMGCRSGWPPDGDDAGDEGEIVVMLVLLPG